MLHRAMDLFKLTAAVSLLLFFLVGAEAKFSESCQCFLLPDCGFDENGIGYKYRQCKGSCAAYSGWVEDSRCGLNFSQRTP
ncbi:hypothetical protein C4580_04705 [Candidatus Woesearchaeota archaeon]|nr:MAG: hypothetical protein C4580_04705 [Candidatus Woesearchaeota archaeon]